MKKMSLLLVGVLVLGLSIPTLAAEVVDWVQWHKDRIESQKVLIDARVEAGLITQAQAESWKQSLDLRQEAIEANPDTFMSGVPGTNFARPFSGRLNRGGFRGGHQMMGRGFGSMMMTK